MKKKRKQKKNSPLKTAIWLAVLFIMLVAIYFAAVLLGGRTQPLTHTDEIPPSPTFTYDDEPLVQQIARWHHQEDLDLDAINRQLPDAYRALIVDEDITANNYPNYLLLSTDTGVPKLHNALADAGYEHTFRNLVVYENRENRLYPVLMIDQDAIHDGKGNRLIDQVPARYGYALLLSRFENDALYSSPIRLIEIVMLDESGLDASDDITLYWSPSDASFNATNTFGAP